MGRPRLSSSMRFPSNTPNCCHQTRVGVHGRRGLPSHRVMAPTALNSHRPFPAIGSSSQRKTCRREGARNQTPQHGRAAPSVDSFRTVDRNRPARLWRRERTLADRSHWPVLRWLAQPRSPKRQPLTLCSCRHGPPSEGCGRICVYRSQSSLHTLLSPLIAALAKHSGCHRQSS